MDTHDTPKIPLPIVEWLERRTLSRIPDPETATVAELRTYAAEARMARMFRVTHEDQISAPFDG